jgi:hypothetical protein
MPGLPCVEKQVLASAEAASKRHPAPRSHHPSQRPGPKTVRHAAHDFMPSGRARPRVQRDRQPRRRRLLRRRPARLRPPSPRPLPQLHHRRRRTAAVLRAGSEPDAGQPAGGGCGAEPRGAVGAGGPAAAPRTRRAREQPVRPSPADPRGRHRHQRRPPRPPATPCDARPAAPPGAQGVRPHPSAQCPGPP